VNARSVPFSRSTWNSIGVSRFLHSSGESALESSFIRPTYQGLTKIDTRP
jgi:hypothetical protein